MSGQTIRNSENKLEALTLQSSAHGVVIPVVGGVARVAGNLIDYFDFTAHPKTETEGGKGGVETQNTTYSYTVSVIMGVAHGRVYAGDVWKGKSFYNGGPTGTQIARSTSTYAVPASGAMTYTLPQAAFIGAPLVAYSGAGKVQVLSDEADYKVVGTTLTVLRDAWRGKTLTIAYQYATVTPAHPGLTTLGLSFAYGAADQTAPAWVTSSDPSRARSYPYLAYLHGQDYALGSGASIENHSMEVVGFGAYRHGSTKPDCNIAEFVAWLLGHAEIGAGLPAGALDVSDWITYCQAAGLLMSPALTTQMRGGDLLQRACELTNSIVVQSYNTIKVLPLCDVEITGNGVTYTPNTTPVYDLTDDWMIGNPPFTRTVRQSDDRYNHVKVEYNDRANYYNKSIAEAQDDGDIALNGRRTKSTITAPWICDANVARLVAQLTMQRDLNIAGGGTCRLPWAFCLLDVGDLVNVADPVLGDELWPMRITRIDEDQDGFLSLTLEDWPLGTAAPTAYTVEVPGGYLHNYNADPGNIDTPAIFEGPAALADGTGIEVMVAARGLNADWGGCHVWVSFDGTNYQRMATIYGASRYGRLNGAITDVSSSMAVDELGDAELAPGSLDDAQNLVTLCYLGGTTPEYVAYEGATLTGPGAYTLSGLVRAAYSSPANARADNSRFVRIDDRVARSGPLDAALVGKQIRIKACSFNRYGRNVQSLADVTAYTYTITGTPAGFDPGLNGKGVVLKASALTFLYPKAGGVTPSSITLTPERKGGLKGAVVWSVVSGTATLTGTGDTRTLTAADLTTDSARIRASVTDAVSTYSDDVTISKVVDGADGGDAPLLSLQCTAQAFTYDNAGSPLPTSQTITFTAALQNLSGTATFTCTRYDAAGASLGTVALGGTGNTRTLTHTQFGTAHYAVVTATLSGLTDTETIVRLRDGSDAITADLTNQSHTLPSDALGNVSSYAGAVSTLVIYEGLTDTSASWTFSRSNSTGVTSTRSVNTVTVTAMTSAVDSGYVDITATRSGYPSVTRRFVLTKSKGATGPGPVDTFRSVSAFGVASGGGSKTVGIRFESDGDISVRTTTTSYNARSTWYSPQAAGVGSGYWVKAELISGTAPGVGGLDVWQHLDADKTWELTRSGTGEEACTLLISVADSSAGTNIIGSGTFYLRATVEP